MIKKIEQEDMIVIEKIARKYNMTMVDFGRAVIAQSKVTNERQYRVSEEEFDIISAYAEDKGLTRMAYSEAACKHLLKLLDDGAADPAVVKFEIGSTRYGQNRTKRIAVRFDDKEAESKLMKIAGDYKIDVGSLIRYCALNY